MLEDNFETINRTSIHTITIIYLYTIYNKSKTDAIRRMSVGKCL